MATSISPVITAIDVLEGLARDYERRARDLRGCVESLRRDFASTTSAADRAASRVHDDVAIDALFDMPDQAPASALTAAPPRVSVGSQEPVVLGSGEAVLPLRRALKQSVVATDDRDDRTIRAWGDRLLPSRIVWRELGGVAFESLEAFRLRVKALVNAGRMEQHGERAGTRYRPLVAPVADVQTVATQSPVVPSVEPAPSVPGVPAAEVDTQPLRAKFAAFLLREVLPSGRVYHIADLVLALHDKFGVSPLDEVQATLDEMCAEGACERVQHGSEVRYAHPKKSVAAQMESRLQADVFSVVGDHGVDRIAAAVRDIPGYSAGMLRLVLDGMVRARKIGVRTVGAERRYARRVS